MENGFPFGWQVPDGIVGFFCGVKRYSTDFFPPMCIDALRCKKSSHFTPQLGKEICCCCCRNSAPFFLVQFLQPAGILKKLSIFFAFLPFRKIEWNTKVISKSYELAQLLLIFSTSSFEYLYEYQVQEHFRHNSKEDVKIWKRKSFQCRWEEGVFYLKVYCRFILLPVCWARQYLTCKISLFPSSTILHPSIGGGLVSKTQK